MGEWVEVNFGSIKHCFQCIDSDRSGAVTFTELKRACIKLNWPGDVRLLFFCLDVDPCREAETRKKALRMDEAGFLDSWHVEPPPAELIAEAAANEPPKPKAISGELMRTITDRLSSPISPTQRALPSLRPRASTEEPSTMQSTS